MAVTLYTTAAGRARTTFDAETAARESLARANAKRRAEREAHEAQVTENARARWKRYKERHREELTEYKREYRRAHKDRINAMNRKRNAEMPADRKAAVLKVRSENCRRWRERIKTGDPGRYEAELAASRARSRKYTEKVQASPEMRERKNRRVAEWRRRIRETDPERYEAMKKRNRERMREVRARKELAESANKR